MVYAAIVLVAGILWTHGAAALPPFHSHQQVMNAFPSKFPTTEAFLEHVDATLKEVDTEMQLASWAYETNITDFNEANATKAGLKYNQILSGLIEESKFYQPNDARQKRLLSVLKSQGNGIPTSVQDQNALAQTLTTLTSIYSTAKHDGMALEPELTEVLAESRDYDELLDAYIGWRNVTGPKMKDLYVKFVELYNKGARDTGYDDAGKMWRSGYDMPVHDFENLIETTWQQVLPLYEQLHCYAGQKLAEKYGADKVLGKDGLLPAHLFGNMWSQDWIYISDLLKPFPDVPPLDVTLALKKQGYNAVKMHELAENFYKSLGYKPLPQRFWDRSMLARPKDREVVCHASAWDLNHNDYRIKMCTVVNNEDVQTVHHEQGHLFYDMHYHVQPKLFRDGAADFFHEAIGDTIVLSFLTPSHLKEIGLLPDTVDDSYKQLINTQLGVALSKLPILPWTYLVDLWRWNVFSGKTSKENYQRHWIELVERYQGLSRPIDSSPDDFDPGAKYHVASNVPYIRYFGAAIIQFQFHEALCEAANHTGPIHKCSIFNLKAAGERFAEMLNLGKSKTWQEAIRVVTQGKSNSLDGKAILDYFEPLNKWLQEQNRGKLCGWGNRARVF